MDTHSTLGAPRLTARRLLVLLVVGFLGGYLLGAYWPQRAVARPGLGGSAADADAGVAAHQGPRPHAGLSPREVVATQVRAMARYRTDPRALEEVWAFASPGNRASQGPIDRFARMISTPPYDEMMTARHWTIGRAVQVEDQAVVLATLYDEQGRASIYRFYLSRQHGECDRCWMTDTVLCLRSKQPPQASPEEQAIPSAMLPVAQQRRAA